MSLRGRDGGDLIDEKHQDESSHESDTDGRMMICDGVLRKVGMVRWRGGRGGLIEVGVLVGMRAIDRIDALGDDDREGGADE